MSLELAPAQVASEYYTAEEMVQFKRPKKKRKIRKKEKVKADDLLPLESLEPSSGASKDHGSRRLVLFNFNALLHVCTCTLYIQVYMHKYAHNIMMYKCG